MEDLLHRYRLALTLVPDADAAGDIFMASRSEADLRRRAARWREQQGLPPVADEQRLLLLTAEQQEHALHLARRGALHRRLKAWLVGVAALVILAGGSFLVYESSRPRLDVDPVFAAAPAQRAPGPGDLMLSVYKVEAQKLEGEGWEVKVWWELTGTGASDRARRLRPELLSLNGRTVVPDLSTRFYSTEPGRLLAVSRFETRSLLVDALLRIEQGRLREGDFMVLLPPAAEHHRP